MKIKNKWNILPKLEKHQFIGTNKKKQEEKNLKAQQRRKHGM